MKKAYVPVIGYHFGFPTGMAATSRARHLARLVQEVGFSSEVVIARATESRRIYAHGKDITHGVSAGVPWAYPGGYRFLSAHRVIRFCERAFSSYRTLRYIASKEPFAVILYARHREFLGRAMPYFKKRGIPVLLEICEWPLARLNSPDRTKSDFVEAREFCNSFLQQTDGAICISTFIEKQVKLFSSGKVPCALIPVLLENPSVQSPARTRQESTLPQREPEIRPYFLSSGSLNEYWPEVELILHAAAVLSKHRQDFALRFLFGNSSNGSRRSWFDRKVEQLGLGSRVQVFGWMPNERFSQQHADAVGLLCVLRDTDQSRARFPNKLTEYLISARPVIATRIGEVSRFFDGQEGAILVKPESVESLADAMIRLLAEPALAAEVGGKGRAIAVKEFSLQANANRMRSILSVISKNSRAERVSY